MKHRFYDGVIFHKRFAPKKHDFKYKFFMLDMQIDSLEELDNSVFSQNSFNLFSFYAKDHFGKTSNFKENIDVLLKRFNLPTNMKMRFVTLPRILGFVFNPISLLILLEEDKPKFMLAEVHNYNGGRVVYPLKLNSNNEISFKAETTKDMYVSPFFKRDGDYKFTLVYDKDKINLNIELYEDNEKMLVSNFSAKSLEFSKKSIYKLFFKHSLLTVLVVTRTLYQSLKLKLKGLKFNSPIKQDQLRRY